MEHQIFVLILLVARWSSSQDEGTGSNPVGDSILSVCGETVSSLAWNQEAKVRLLLDWPIFALVITQCITSEMPVGTDETSVSKILNWGRMYQGGEIALQANCGEFDSHRFHQIF